MVSDFELALLRRMMNEWGENFGLTVRAPTTEFSLLLLLAVRFSGWLSSNFRQTTTPLVQMGFVQLSAREKRDGIAGLFVSSVCLRCLKRSFVYVFQRWRVVSMPKVNAYCAQCAIDSLPNVYWCIRMECVWICCVDIICVEYLHTCLGFLFSWFPIFLDNQCLYYRIILCGYHVGRRFNGNVRR